MIIPFFLLNRGCPHRCIYCNTRQIAGKTEEPLTEEHINRTVNQYISPLKNRTKPVELAFYGGNFTGLAPGEQARLLKITDALIEEGMIDRVRIATRPDDMDERLLENLRKCHVETIEIGAQSLADDVLALAGRGHTAEDVRRAVKLARAYGLTIGLHLMAGLPGDDEGKFLETIRKTVELQPDMVRLHPTLVFSDTPLADLLRSGEYTPLSLDDAIRLCKSALVEFEKARIPVIRLGLQATELMQEPGSLLAGPFHPSFRSLVEASLFRDMALRLLQQRDTEETTAAFCVNPRDVSSFRGEKNGNIRELRKLFCLEDLTVATDSLLERGTLILASGNTDAPRQLKWTDLS